MIGISRILVGAASLTALVSVAKANPADLDTTFATGGTFTGEDSNCAEFRKLLILRDGRILAGANAADPPPNEGSIHRFHPNGTRDTSFGGGDGIVWLLDLNLMGSSNPEVKGLVEFPDSETAATVSDGSSSWVLRLDENGAPVSAFDGDGILPGPWTSLTRLGSADLLVAGKDGSSNLLLGRLDSAGALVTSFGSGGTVTSIQVDRASQVLVQPNGNILVGGDKSGGFFVARFLSDGSPDSSFGTSGAFEHSSALENFREMTLTSDGRIVVTGCEAGSGICSAGDSPIAVRLTSLGALDTSFDGDGIASPSPPLGSESTGLALQRNGDLLLSGHASPVERLLFDGTLDPSFGSGGVGYNIGWDVAVQRDGKILLATSNYNGVNLRCQLHRLLGDPVEVPAMGAPGVAAVVAAIGLAGLLALSVRRRAQRRFEA